MIFSEAWLAAKNHKLEVWTEHLAVPVLIGRLNYEVAAGVGYFEWAKSALDAQLVLSPIHMPLTRSVWSSREQARLPQEYRGLPGMLNDALPDGWGLHLMDRALTRLAIKPEYVTPAVRLAYLGERAWGALTFRPVIEDDHGQDMALDVLGRGVEAAIEGHVEEVSNEMLKAGSSGQGARPKVMVDLSVDHKWARVTGGVPKSGFSSWLIKFAARDEAADAPIVEQAYMELARDAGLSVMDSMLMDINGKPAFATQRFDRAQGTRAFCHTLGGLIHFSHREIGLDYAHAADAMDALSVPETSYRQAYSRAVFNAALSVRDDHSKNFAFTLDQTHQWDVSPAYDLTYMEGPSGHHTLTFAGGTARDPTRDDLLRLAGYYRVAPADAAHIIDNMLDVAAEVGKVALGLGASKATVSPIVHRLQEISRPLMASRRR